jgi:hypothetical protein
MPIHAARQLGLPIITDMVLEEFDGRVRAGFGRELPVPFYHTNEHDGFVCDLL